MIIKLCREINKLRRCMCVEGLLLTYITICDFTCSFICRNEVVHYNPIVRKFPNIALRCARSPMGANIARLRYLYYVSFDMKLHANEQSICNLYKLHNDNEEYATVGVLLDWINCIDGINDIHYFNYDYITVIIYELCTN